MHSDSHQPGHTGSEGRFETTHWSVVLAAGQTTSPESRGALETLCRKYWYPIYAYTRRRGQNPQDAMDTVQGFFAVMLDKHYIRAADQSKGRFRSFLLTALKYHMSHERERARALKRGGGHVIVPLHVDDAEGRYALEPSHNWTPDRIYERRWAITLLDRALERVKGEFVEAGKQKAFDHLKQHLTGDGSGVAYKQTAAALGTTEGAVKTAVHRLRKRYRNILRAEIAETLADPANVDEELECLLEALQGG